MKVLSKPAAERKIKVENEELVSRNIRLRQFERTITNRLNTIKDSYEPDKLQKLKEFEEFCKQINIKREKLLKELTGIQQLIEEKKELYYALITKSDALEERAYQIREEGEKLRLREAFVSDLEAKWQEKQ